MNAPISPPSILVSFVPVMTRDQFAELVGVTRRTVDGWVSRGYVPVIRFASSEGRTKNSLVNVAALNRQCLEVL